MSCLRSNPVFTTVIMPVYNEAGFITRSLGAVLAQDYPADCLEIIVADGMSTDGTREIVRSFQALNPGVKLIDNPRRFVSTGLNLGFQQARGEVIVRVDGHCVIAPNYITRCVEHLMGDGFDGVGGPVSTVGETAVARAIATAMSSRFGVGGSAFRISKQSQVGVDTIAFPAYKRSVIERAGPFDEELVRNQDDEYNYRLRKMGGRLLLSPDVRSSYYSRASISGLWNQYWGYGYWKVRVLQKHPRQMSARQFVPPVLIASLMIALTLAPLSVIGIWLFGIIGGCYLCGNLVASLWKASSGASLLLLPAAFAAIHFGYGLGFLTGMFRFLNRWVWRTSCQTIQIRS